MSISTGESPQGDRPPGAVASRTGNVLLVATSAALGVAGVVLLAAAMLQWVSAAAHRAEAALAFDALWSKGHAATSVDVRGQQAQEAATPGRVQGRIVIPRVGVDAIILEGVHGSVLDRGVGHVPGTAPLGGNGNIVLAGHRDTDFRGLRDIAVGDTIAIQDFAGERRYRVEAVSVVEPDEVGVLEPTASEVVTLITCHPFGWIGPAPRRFVVRAVRARRDKERRAGPARSQRRGACSRSIDGTQAR